MLPLLKDRLRPLDRFVGNGKSVTSGKKAKTSLKQTDLQTAYENFLGREAVTEIPEIKIFHPVSGKLVSTKTFTVSFQKQISSRFQERIEKRGSQVNYRFTASTIEEPLKKNLSWC